MTTFHASTEVSPKIGEQSDQRRSFGVLGQTRDRWIVIALLLFALGIELVVLHDHSGIMLDDGYYYLKIAQSIAQGKGSTFDGVNPTNGYHPLWLITLVPFFLIANDPNTANLLAAYLQVALYLCIVAMIYLTARLGTSPLTASLAASLWVFLTYSLSITGLEFSLYALLVCITAFFYLSRFGRGQPQTLQSYVALGLVCSLTFLARLDSILLPVSLAFFLIGFELRGGRESGRVGRMLAFGLPVLFTGLAYAAVNLIQFGHILTISGVVKQAWSEHRVSLDPAYQSQGWLVSRLNVLLAPIHLLIDSTHLATICYALVLINGIFGALVLLVTAGVLRFTLKSDRFDLYLRPLAPFALFSFLISFTYVLLFPYAYAYYPWYYVIQPWFAVILITALMQLVLRASVAAGRRKRSMRWLHRIGTIGLFVLVCGVPLETMRNLWLPSLFDTAPVPDPLYVTARWLSANIPDNAIVGSWSAGIIGYFSGRRVINLDGLVNSWDFYESGQLDLCGYWRRSGVDYLADYFQDDRAGAPMPAYPHYAQCANQLQLLWSYTDPRNYPEIRVYRIRWADK